MDWASGRLLRNRVFRTVAGGEVISLLGDCAYQVAFAWLVLSVTGSALTLAAVMICNVVPNGLLIPVGGAVTDRWSAKRVMFCLHLARGLLVWPVRAHGRRLAAHVAVLRDGSDLRAG